MYIPQLFGTTDLDLSYELMREHPFAAVVVHTASGLAASHVPCVLDRSWGAQGRLLVHFANANPLVSELCTAGMVLVIFSGPHCYVTPDAYASQGHLPTWLFSTVHVHAKPVKMDAEGLESQLQQLIHQEESRLAGKAPWTLERGPSEIVSHFRTLITGFELRIDRIETCFKLNQHKNPADLAALVGNLRAAEATPLHEVGAAVELHASRARPEDIDAYKRKYRMGENK